MILCILLECDNVKHSNSFPKHIRTSFIEPEQNRSFKEV